VNARDFAIAMICGAGIWGLGLYALVAPLFE